MVLSTLFYMYVNQRVVTFHGKLLQDFCSHKIVAQGFYFIVTLLCSQFHIGLKEVEGMKVRQVIKFQLLKGHDMGL